MNVSDDRKELFKAISAAQGEFTTVEKGKDNPFFKSKYAPLDSIIEMIRPILPKHGLSVVQFTDIPQDGQGVIVETIITHESGQYISGRLLMPMAKVDPQGAGSAISYGRRYALAAALNIVSDEDVDGNGHGEKEKKPANKTAPTSTPAPDNKNASQGNVEPSKAQIDLLNELAEFCKGDTEQMGAVLDEVSRYKEGPQGALDLKSLEKGNTNEKFQKWTGSALGRLRKKVADVKEMPF